MKETARTVRQASQTSNQELSRKILPVHITRVR